MLRKAGLLCCPQTLLFMVLIERVSTGHLIYSRSHAKGLLETESKAPDRERHMHLLLVSQAILQQMLSGAAVMEWLSCKV